MTVARDAVTLDFPGVKITVKYPLKLKQATIADYNLFRLRNSPTKFRAAALSVCDGVV